MLERYIQSVRIESPGEETPAATRERLRELYPRGVSRRMTQLGLLLGSVLRDTAVGVDDTLVYASKYGESHALEEYLASFPTPSPTLFQTSIHPSAVQQALIARPQPVREFWPHTGGVHLPAQAVQSALLARAPRVILCGGEERGSWLREQQVASDTTFAFAMLLTTSQENARGVLRLEQAPGQTGELSLQEFFSALQASRTLQTVAAPGILLSLECR